MRKPKLAPLSTTFTLVSILGVIFSAIYIMDKNATYGVAFTLVFLCMFLASMRSMRYANPDDQLRM